MFNPRVISAEELASDLKSGNERILVVDVRDADRVGGHIKSSLNIPSHALRDNLQSIYSKALQYDKIVFHCMKSQVRGPKCARIFNEFAFNQNSQFNPQVLTLQGGFQSWQSSYGTDSDLTEAYDKEGWEKGFYE